MAKAPRPGKVKTRLCPPLTPNQSAALNICFLRDSTANLHDVASEGGAAGLVCYTPEGEEALFNGLLPQSFGLILQRGDTFGERLLLAAQDVLACGFGAVCLIDSDSPTVPTAAYRLAVAELNRPGDRMVLGGSADGGYYLIGLKQPHPEPFENVTWSTASVFAETIVGARRAGLDVVELPLWYDVDDGPTLDLLELELLQGVPPHFATMAGYPAIYSRKYLEELRSEAVRS